MFKPEKKTFAEGDAAFFLKRGRFAEKRGDADFWFVADNWPLFAGAVNIAKSLAIYELVKQVVHLPGYFCELGCFNGKNLVYLAKLAEILRPRELWEVYGFDSFEGLQTLSADKDGEAEVNRGRYKGDPDLLLEALDLHGLDDRVRLVRGDILETVPRFVAENPHFRFAYISIDVDLYEPAKVAIECLYPLLLKGGIMVFDEYGVHDWPGETRAVHDALGPNVELRRVPFTRQPTAYLVK